MDTYIKIDDKTATIEKVVTITETVNVDQLEYDRDSLVRTQADNTQNAIDQNAKIQILIDALDVKIAELNKLGMSGDKAVIEAALRPGPIVEEPIEEVVG